MRFLRDLLVNLDANSSKFLRGMDSAANSVQRFEQSTTRRLNSVTRAFTGVGAVIGSALALGGLRDAVTEYAAAADEMLKFGGRIGESVEDLSRLGHAAELSGVSMETLTSSLRAQSNRIGLAIQGNTAYTESLADIGISVEEIEGLDPSETFLRIAQGMEGVEDSAQRVAIAQRLWGASGTALLQIVDAGTEGIREMMEESDALGNTLSTTAAQDAANFNDEVARLTAELGGVARQVLTLVLPAITQLVRGIRFVIRGFVEFGRAVGRALDWVIEQWERFKETVRNALRVIEPVLNFMGIELAQAAEQSASAIDENNRAVGEMDRIYEDASQSIGTFTRTNARVVETVDDSNRAMDDLGNSADDAGRKIEGLDETTGALIITVSGGNQELERYTQTLEEQLEVYDQNQAKIRELTLWFERLDPEEQARQMEFYREELRRLGEDVPIGPMETWVQLVEQSIERLDNTFAGFWRDLLRGNEDVFDAFRNLALDTLAEIIHAFTTRPIVARISSAIEGVLGPAKPGEQQGGILGTILGGLGSLAGGIVGLGVTAAAGSLLGSLFGSGSRIKETQLFAGNLGGILPGGLAINTPSPFGSNIAFGFHRVGGEGQLSNRDAEQILETLSAASRVIVGIDEMIVGTLDQFQVSSINERLERMRGSLNYEPANVDRFIQTRFRIIFEEIDESLGEAFDQFAVAFEGDELLGFVQQVGALQEAFSQGERIFTDVAGSAETLTLLMGEMAQQGDTLAAVLERISAANGILGALGLTGDTAGGAQFNLDVLSEVGGDLGRLSELVSGFFATFFTEIENLERQQAVLGGIVPDLLAGLDTTREGFASDLLGGIEQGLFSPEDIALWLEAGEALGELLEIERRLTELRAGEAQQAREAEIAAINEQVATLTASADAVQLQIDAQRRLQAQIEQIAQSIEQTFGSAIENIQFSILDRAGQVNFLENQIDALTESLSAVTDPQELESVLSEIASLTLQLFNLFDPERQAQVSEQLIADLSAVQEEGQLRLTELSEVAQQRELELLAQQEELQQRIADQMEQAALLNAQSSESFSSAVAQFSEAAANPAPVPVFLDLPGEAGVA